VDRFSVVVCGGGVAGLEALLRLRRFAGDRLDITLVTPATELVYRPLAVLEPFAAGRLRRYPLARIVADTGTRWVRDALGWVDPGHRVVHTDGDHGLPYDALLLAVGGREVPPGDGSFLFTDRTAGDYRTIAEQTASGAVGSLLFAAPDGPSWPLPLFELALLTSAQARAAGRLPELAITTPAGPLGAFGAAAGEAITGVLDAAHITLYAGCTAHLVRPRQVLVRPAGVELHPDHLITVPRVTGPNVRGIPGDAVDRFLPIDGQCRVRGLDGRVFAAGDATDLPVKQGGVGAQQADTAAAGILELAGLGAAPPPLHPVIHGVVFTGGQPIYLTAYLIAGRGWRAQVHRTQPWPIEEKIVAEELGPYLAALNASTPSA
jgi:sulfide:quinone oxidoreductase